MPPVTQIQYITGEKRKTLRSLDIHNIFQSSITKVPYQLLFDPTAHMQYLIIEAGAGVRAYYSVINFKGARTKAEWEKLRSEHSVQHTKMGWRSYTQLTAYSFTVGGRYVHGLKLDWNYNGASCEDFANLLHNMLACNVFCPTIKISFVYTLTNTRYDVFNGVITETRF